MFKKGARQVIFRYQFIMFEQALFLKLNGGFIKRAERALSGRNPFEMAGLPKSLLLHCFSLTRQCQCSGDMTPILLDTLDPDKST